MKPLPKKALTLSLFILSSVSVVICFILTNSGKPFWYDEVVTIYLVKDRSLLHMFQAMGTGLDTAPPAFHVIAWFWVRLLGNGDTALRLLSCILMIGALGILSLIMWSLYQRFILALASATVVLFGSNLVLYHVSEARFYGLYMACFAGMVYCYYRILADQPSHGIWFVINFVLHALFVHTHYVGFVFSGAIGLSCLLSDLMRRRLRWRFYFSVVAAWMSFAILWLPTFREHIALTRVSTWIAVPWIGSLFEYYRDLVFFPYASFIVLGCYIVIKTGDLLIRKRNHIRPSRSPQARVREALRILAICVFLMPIAVFIISRVVTPIFVERYMLPALIGLALLVGDAAYTVVSLVTTLWNETETLKRTITGLFALVILAVSLLPIAYGYQKASAPDARPDVKDAAFGYPSLPIVSQYVTTFLPRLYYSQDNRYYFVIDRDLLADPKSNPFLFTVFQMMEGFRSYFPESATTVIDSDAFLRTHEQFLVLQDKIFTGGSDLWMDKHFKNNPAYRSEVIAETPDYWVTLVLKTGS